MSIEGDVQHAGEFVHSHRYVDLAVLLGRFLEMSKSRNSFALGLCFVSSLYTVPRVLEFYITCMLQAFRVLTTLFLAFVRYETR